MSSFTKFLVGTLTVGLVGVMSVLFLATAVTRYNLISPAFWFIAGGLIFSIGGGWLVTAGGPGGKLFAGLGAVLLLLGAYKAIWPNTSAATGHVQEVADLQAARALNSQVAPLIVRCDRDSKTRFWDSVTGSAIIFYSLNSEKRLIECADRTGFNAFTGQEYKPVTPEIVKIIMTQEPPPVPVPVATPSPAPIPVAVVVVASPTPEPQVEATPPRPQKTYHITARPMRQDGQQ